MEIYIDGLSVFDVIEVIFMIVQDQCVIIGIVYVYLQCVFFSYIGDCYQIINCIMVGSVCGIYNGKGNKFFSFGLFNCSFKFSYIYCVIRQSVNSKNGFFIEVYLRC